MSVPIPEQEQLKWRLRLNSFIAGLIWQPSCSKQRHYEGIMKNVEILQPQKEQWLSAISDLEFPAEKYAFN